MIYSVMLTTLTWLSGNLRSSTVRIEGYRAWVRSSSGEIGREACFETMELHLSMIDMLFLFCSESTNAETTDGRAGTTFRSTDRVLDFLLLPDDSQSIQGECHLSLFFGDPISVVRPKSYWNIWGETFVYVQSPQTMQCAHSNGKYNFLSSAYEL